MRNLTFGFPVKGDCSKKGVKSWAEGSGLGKESQMNDVAFGEDDLNGRSAKVAQSVWHVRLLTEDFDEVQFALVWAGQSVCGETQLNLIVRTDVKMQRVRDSFAIPSGALPLWWPKYNQGAHCNPGRSWPLLQGCPSAQRSRPGRWYRTDTLLWKVSSA